MADTVKKTVTETKTATPEITPELVMELMARNEQLVKELQALKEQKSAPAPTPKPTPTKGGKNPNTVKGFKNAETTSARIRLLLAAGWTKWEIFKNAGLKTRNGDAIRYQHVRNVAEQPLKRQV